MEDIIAQLKALPLTAKIDSDEQGVFGQIAEFQDEIEEEATIDATIRALAQGLKGWANVLSSQLDKVNRNDIPYLLKALISTQDELEQCLRKNM